MPFEKKLIPFAATHSFSDLVLDYLNGDEKLKPFYDYPFSIEGFKQAIEKRKSTTVNRTVLVEVIEQQFASISEKSVLLNSNIELLKSENTFTVTTGHQLNIFTGPLYFIYKIFSAVNLAEQLKKDFPENNFVPVYWMASEDHDFAEINHINVFDKKIEWLQDKKGATGNIPTTTFQNVIDELKTILGEGENAKYLIEIFEKAYVKNENLTTATRCLVNEIFGKYGLIVLDASDKKLKQLFIPILKQDLLEQVSFKEVTATTNSLNKHHKSQVHARPINLFYMQDGLRERIEKENSVYKVLNTELTFTESALLEELENHPENFSPNVILRPVYQETILPNIAYVGGGAEVSYWMQYKSMFAAFDTFFPILVLRDSVQFIDKGQMKKINSFGFELTQLFLTYDELVKVLLSKSNDENLNISDETVTLEKLFDAFALKVAAIDPTLSATVNAEKQKAINGLKLLDDKTTKALKRKHETALTQLKTLKEKLFPGNGLQERHINLSMFYSKYGNEFLEVLKASLNPMQKQFIILAEKE
jgi:bacillithiol biosynthesis cysteine-adding enzyme BshC